MSLDFGDLVLTLFKTTHILAASIWVGGNLFWALILGPLHRKKGLAGTVSTSYRELVGIAILLLLISGVYLMIDTLMNANVGPAWIFVLLAKMFFSLWMIYIYWEQRKRSPLSSTLPRWRRYLSALIGYDALLGLGIVVLLLSSLLERVL